MNCLEHSGLEGLGHLEHLKMGALVNLNHLDHLETEG